MPSLITARNLTLKKQGNLILDNIGMEVAARDFITIIGPNGAGKSMLLKCLMGFETLYKGTVHRQPDLKIGYVPQVFEINKTMPIRVKSLLELKNPNISQAVGEVGVEDLLDKSLVDLSNGELQRVLLARAIAAKPQLLILDEPAQNLDIPGQVKLYKLLGEIYQKYQLAILMVSHDLHMVMASTKQVICLFRHICCSGKPHKVTKDPSFQKLFGSDVKGIMATYNHRHDHAHS